MTENPGDPPKPRSLFASLPSYADREDDPNTPFRDVLRAERERSEVSEIPCDECGLCRPGVKGYTLPYILFLLFYVQWQLVYVNKCPSCMRRFLMLRGLVAIAMANLLSPLIILWWSLQFLRTFFH